MLADVPRLTELLTRHFLPADGDDETRGRIVIRRAVAHGLTAYADEVASSAEWPQIIRGALADRRRVEAHHALELANVLRTLSASCEDAGISLLTMKGVALSASLHGDISRRGTRDIDVLIEPESFGTVATVLLDSGCVPHDPWRSWTPREFAARATSYHEFGFSTPTGVTVEVHTRLTTRFLPHAPSFDELWQRRRPVRLAGQDVPTLAWPDAVVHLSTHGFRHAWERLVWLCDIAHLMARSDVDWEHAQTLARARHERVALVGALLAARDVLGAPMPPGVSVPRRAVIAAREVHARLTRGDLRPTGITMLADHWRSRDGWAGAFSYLWRVATTITPADCLPGEAWPPSTVTRWVRRPLRLVRRYVRRPRPVSPSAGR